MYYLGTLVGCLIGGWVGDKIGRVRTIAFGAAWAIFGAALQCSAQNHIWMIFARLINGWGTGVLVSIPSSRTEVVYITLTGVVFQNAIVPVWATETAEHTSRGKRKKRILDNFELAYEQRMLCC